jgi:hypothetical protein
MIAVDWSIIIFSAMETTDKLLSYEKEPTGKLGFFLGLLSKSLLDAFFILNVDLSADAVAIRMGTFPANFH